MSSIADSKTVEIALYICAQVFKSQIPAWHWAEDGPPRVNISWLLIMSTTCQMFGGSTNLSPLSLLHDIALSRYFFFHTSRFVWKNHIRTFFAVFSTSPTFLCVDIAWKIKNTVYITSLRTKSFEMWFVYYIYMAQTLEINKSSWHRAQLFPHWY